MIRFRYATEHAFEPDFSYAISKEVITGYNNWKFKKRYLNMLWKPPRSRIYINKSNLKVQIHDLDDVPINEDDAGFHWEENYDYGGNVVKMTKVTQTG